MVSGSSLKDIAAQIPVDLSVLARWERGEQLAPIEAVESLDKVFGASGTLIALRALVDVAKSGVVPVAGTSGVPDPVDMDEARRRLLLGAAGVGVSAALLPGLEQLRTIVDTRLGGPDLTEWEEIAWEHAHRVVSRTIAEAIRDLSVDLLTLQRMLPSVPSRDAVGWGRVNARLTFLLANTLGLGGGAGHAHESRHWWAAARRAADQTGDAEFTALAYAYEAVQALYEGRPLSLVLSRADTALALTAKQPARAAAEALCARAYALTLLGDHAGAHASLERQADVFDDLPDIVTRDSTSAEGWPESRLLHTRSLVLTMTGHQSAASAQSDALASYPSLGRSRQGAQIRLHQAASAVREGSVSDGLQYAVSIIESLGPHVTQFVLHVAHGVADAVPAGHATHRAIVEYREKLALTAPKEDK